MMLNLLLRSWYKIKDGDKLIIQNCSWENVAERVRGLKQHLNEILEYTENYGIQNNKAV